MKCGRPPRSRAAVVAAVAGASAAAAAAEQPPALGSPLTRTVALEPVAPAKKRRRLVPLVVAALLLLLLLGAGWWWWSSQSAAPEVVSGPVTSQPAVPPAASPAPTQTRPRSPGLATLRLQGEHDLDQGTLYLYADDKLVDQFSLGSNGQVSGSLRLSADTRTVTVRVRGPAATSPEWVPRGLRKKRKPSSSITFDQKRTLSANLQPGQARTLLVRADRTRGLSVRWSD